MKHVPVRRCALLLLSLPSLAFAMPAFSQSRGTNATALSDAIRNAAKTDDVRAFYAAAGWQTAWSQAAIGRLRSALAKRAQHGLDRMTFDEPSPQSPVAERDASWTRLALRCAALRYASALARGALEPSDLHEVYTLPRPQADLAKQLASAVASGRVEAWLDSLAPDDAEYRKLSEAYRTYAEQPPREDRIAKGDVIHLGDADAQVKEIADLLATNGYLAAADRPGDDGAGKAIFTQAIADAVKATQRDYGINADGIVGRDSARSSTSDRTTRRAHWLSRSSGDAGCPATRPRRGST